ncbi:SUF system NifU family Fe-S cluster assembly protein [Candidatus Woesearchaeota archaeon]|nr:SUF system NifU family Fe-S cluster assembly protein [Candidatus Woesearchaeota archaeon]
MEKKETNAIEELYREELMDHYQNPRNQGELAGADVSYHDHNPVCGDEVTMQLKVSDGEIKDAKFTGKGCAISQAAASMLTEEAKGKKTRQLLQMKTEDVLQILKINPGPVRIKCALLALRALQKGLLKYEAKLLKAK